MAQFRTKKHRLPEAAYRGIKCVSFTANEVARRKLFCRSEIVTKFIEELDIHAARFECIVLIYCFMPDHLHVMIRGESQRADAKASMNAFKYKTGLWLKEQHPDFE